MIKLLKKLFKKEKTVKETKETSTEVANVNNVNSSGESSCLKRPEFYDRFVVVKNEEGNTIKISVEEFSYDYDYYYYEIIGEEKATVELPSCTIEISLNNKKDATGEIALTNIIVREADIPFKIKIYTEKLEAIVTEPQEEIEVDRFKIKIK